MIELIRHTRKKIKTRLPWLITLFTLTVALASCGAFALVDLNAVRIGMSKEEVLSSIEKRPDNVIAAKEYEDGILEILQYSGRISRSPADQGNLYWLYFFNDRLVEWGPAPRQPFEMERYYQERDWENSGR